jgi:hypothetical protein
MYNKNNFIIANIAGETLDELRVEKNRTIASDTYRMIIVETPDGVDINDFPPIGDDKPLREIKEINISKGEVKKIIKAFDLVKNKNIIPILKNAVFTSQEEEKATLLITNLNEMQKIRCDLNTPYYPDCQKILDENEVNISDKDKFVSIKLDIELLGGIIETIKKMNVEKREIDIYISKNEKKPITFKAMTQEGKQKITALLMPKN